MIPLLGIHPKEVIKSQSFNHKEFHRSNIYFEKVKTNIQLEGISKINGDTSTQ